MITKVSSNLTGYEETIAYDNLSRISSRSESFDGNEFTASYSYNQKGDITNILLNSTVSIVNSYNTFGFPYQVTVNNQTVWTANSMDKYSQVNNFTLENQANTSISYDQYGFLDKIVTQKGSTYLQNWDYDSNYLTGNLSKRKGLNSTGSVVEENFPNYDPLNRLKTSTVGATTISVSYDNNGLGNIISETGLQRNDSIYNFLFEVKLINNSVVPVRFLTSSCSTVQYIVLDSKNVRLWINNCARNSITVIELKPYQQFIFPVVLQTEVKFAYSEFRMGYVLLSPEIKIESVYNELFRSRENFENVVWSDTIRLQPEGGESYYEVK